MKIPRAEVYAAIDGERDYQDNKWGGEKMDAHNGVGDFIRYTEKYLARAQQEFAAGNVDQALENMRKVTALGVACMEYHGAPKRV